MNGEVQSGPAAAWVLVPDGSTFHLSTRSETGDNDFAASGRLTTAEGAPTFWEDAELHDGPCTFVLQSSADRYDGEVAIAFDSVEENRAAIEASITTPAGQPHGIPYRHVVSGRRDDVALVSLLIGMSEV